MQQSYERWQEPPEVSCYLDSVTLAAFPDGSAVLLLVSTDDGESLKITFPHTQAISAHDEDTHWLMDECGAAIPQLACGGAYPLLIVRNSNWAASLSDIRRGMNEEPPTHYLFISLNNHVDVLTYAKPIVERVDSEAWERL